MADEGRREGAEGAAPPGACPFSVAGCCVRALDGSDAGTVQAICWGCAEKFLVPFDEVATQFAIRMAADGKCLCGEQPGSFPRVSRDVKEHLEKLRARFQTEVALWKGEDVSQRGPPHPLGSLQRFPRTIPFHACLRVVARRWPLSRRRSKPSR